ncbi:AraC family transcriptional regulator [Reichenbachiella carrageenanivorans]|uniref:AraC family transcriptional regulator n=1 Tax=Reichenbachiella carrageenanivorans TaxID=2979869 RepID=A0ABY6D7I5_9BACT|nr:AraC family transcriptional regulator [Reichenbachiella carrageenanivorans]UXX81028.1 AraC family transcriptional regulator [Reichenbachiella carrageenanivorans]
MKIALYIWVSFQSILFGGSVLFFKRNLLNKLLAAFFFSTGLHTTLNYFVRFTEVKFDFPRLLGYGDVFNLLYGPILYLYIKSIIDNKLDKRSYLHMMPAVILFVSLCVFHFTHEKINFMTYLSHPMHRVAIFSVVFSNILYLVLSVRIYVLHFKENYAVEKWISVWFTIAISFLALKVIINGAFLSSFYVVPKISAELRNVLVYIFISLNALIVSIAGVYTLRFPNVFRLHSTKLFKKKTDTTSSEPEPVDEILEALQRVLEEKRLHLRNDITEREVAKEIDIQPYILSKVLNENLGMNFNRYINNFRIEEAKRILLSPDTNDATNYSIALDSGFKTESVYYSNFKKIVGMTPKQFQKQHE